MISKLLRLTRDFKRHSQWLRTTGKGSEAVIMALILLGLMIPAISTALAYLSKLLLDSASMGDMDGFVTAVVWFASLTVLRILLNFTSAYQATMTQERIAYLLQNRCLESIFYCDWLSGTTWHAGDILIRLQEDVDRIAGFYTGILPTLVSVMAEFCLAFGLLMWLSPTLALLGLLLGPVVALLGLLFTRKINRLQKAIMDNESAYQSCLNESVQHLVIIKCFQIASFMQNRIRGYQNSRLALLTEQNRKILTAGIVSSFGFNLSFVIAFTWGAYEIARGQLTFGTFTAFLQLITLIQSPISTTGRMLPQLATLITAIDRFMELANIPSEPDAAPLRAPTEALGIRLSRVCYRYTTTVPVLEDTSLTIEPGEHAVLLGPSGSGKTTLIRILLQLIRPQAGTIALIAPDSSEDLINTRSAYTYVPQGNTLFAGTLAENLRIGNPMATDSELWEALATACADGFASELPQGLDTILGEQGTGLSEGQAQRLCIARALLRKAPVLILDEATSALDAGTEGRFLENLRNWHMRPTCILITHREAVCAYADRTYHLADHHLVEKKLSEH